MRCCSERRDPQGPVPATHAQLPLRQLPTGGAEAHPRIETLIEHDHIAHRKIVHLPHGEDRGAQIRPQADALRGQRRTRPRQLAATRCAARGQQRLQQLRPQQHRQHPAITHDIEYRPAGAASEDPLQLRRSAEQRRIARNHARRGCREHLVERLQRALGHTALFLNLGIYRDVHDFSFGGALFKTEVYGGLGRVMYGRQGPAPLSMPSNIAFGGVDPRTSESGNFFTIGANLNF